MIRKAVCLLAGVYFCGAHAQTQGLKSGIYKFSQNAISSSGLQFQQGEFVQLELRADGQAELKFQSELAESGETTDSTLLTQSDLNIFNLSYVMAGSAKDFAALNNTLSPMRKGGPNTGRARLHYAGAEGCVAYVIRAIGWHGGRTGNGWEVTRTLKRSGWSSTSCSNPPVGAVASWSGGHTGAGHTAIWSGSCWAYDLACADPGHLYHLEECVAR